MKTAKLFRNGQSQAVRLPKEFRFEGEQVFIQRIGNAVVLLPVDAPFRTLFESLPLFTDDFTDTPAHTAAPIDVTGIHGNQHWP
jgi:antitoxin VapB